MSVTDLTERWFQKAHNDLIVATHLYENFWPKQIEIACFLSQQAAEKSLKAFVQHKGLEVPRTHILPQLCQMCMEFNKAFAQISDACSELTIYGVAARYPDEHDITEEEAESAVKKAREIYDFCRLLVK